MISIYTFFDYFKPLRFGYLELFAKAIGLSVWLLLLIAPYCFAQTSELDAALIGYWGFDKIEGNKVIDGSLFNRHGELSMGATITDAGVVGSALELEGNGGHVAIPDFRYRGKGISIIAWIKLEGHTIDPRIFSKAEGAAEPHHEIMFSLGGFDKFSNTLRLRLRLGDRTYTWHGNTIDSIKLNTWAHIAMVYDGKALLHYKNGERVGGIYAQGVVMADSPWPTWIGENPGYGRPFHGKIDEVRVYSKGLSAEEVGLLMNIGSKETLK